MTARLLSEAGVKLRQHKILDKVCFFSDKDHISMEKMVNGIGKLNVMDVSTSVETLTQSFGGLVA